MYTKSIYIKSYIYIVGSHGFILEIQIEGLNLEFEPGWFEVGIIWDDMVEDSEGWTNPLVPGVH